MVRENIVFRLARADRADKNQAGLLYVKGTRQPVVQVVLLDGDGEGTRREGRTSRMVQNS